MTRIMESDMPCFSMATPKWIMNPLDISYNTPIDHPPPFYPLAQLTMPISCLTMIHGPHTPPCSNQLIKPNPG